MADLYAHYNRTKTNARKNRDKLAQIQREYDCCEYTNEDGRVMANFGQLAMKVNQALTTYVDYATERSQWARIETYEGINESQAFEWGGHITAAFQRYCIKPWCDKSDLVMLACKDMLLFSNGSFLFEDEYCVYPTHLEILNLWPDLGAKMRPKSFDVCHVRVTKTAVELFRMSRMDHGGLWDKKAVLNMIRNAPGIKKESTNDAVWKMFDEGTAPSDVCENSYDLVISFVREFTPQYDNDSEGKKITSEKSQISVYIYPESGTAIPRKSRDQKDADARNELGYLYKESCCYEEMTQALGVIAHTVCKNFYENPSFAQMIYAVSVVYNNSMNRIIEAAEDNMRVYLKSSTSEIKDKLTRMRHGQWNVLPAGVDIQQQGISRPIDATLIAVRQVTQDNNAGLGQYRINDQTVNGSDKTATQSNIDLSESTKVSSSSLKVLNSYMSDMIREVYRRFTTKCTEASPHHAMFKRFKDYLKLKGVPTKAWMPENVQIESIFDLGAGSPAAKLQGARVIREALSVAARSPGEQKAAKMMISSVVGVENVNEFIPDTDQMVLPEDSLIGLENDSLMQPNANPKNIPVQPTQLHMRHIPAHIANAEGSLAVAQQLFEGIPQMPKGDEGIYLKQVMDILIGIDNTLAHAQAHMQMASREQNPAKQQEIQQMAGQMNQINKVKDGLEQALNQAQQARMDGGAGTEEELKFSHQQKMNALIEEHEAQMLAFDMQKNMQKSQQQLQIKDNKAQHDMNLKTVATQHGAALDEIVAGSKIRIQKAQQNEKATPPKPSKPKK